MAGNYQISSVEPPKDAGSLNLVELFLTLSESNSGFQVTNGQQSHPESVTCEFIISHPRRIRRGRQGISRCIKEEGEGIPKKGRGT